MNAEEVAEKLHIDWSLFPEETFRAIQIISFSANKDGDF